jgi:hypothetical protein
MSATQDPSHPTAGIDDDVEQRYDLSVRWGTALAKRLQRLVRYSSLGLLNQADERRFQSPCEELRTLSDLIDRFDLTQ